MKTWDDVSAYWEKQGRMCADCPFAREESQSHPYGSTTATETWYVCDLLEGNAGESPADCPGMEDEEE